MSDGAANEDQDKIETPQAEPLATTRSRRANAGNLMGKLIQDEEDEVYTSIYGGFEEEEDDEDFDDGGRLNEEDDDDDDDDIDGDESSDSDDDSDSSSGQEDERAEASPEGEDKNLSRISVHKNKSSAIEHKVDAALKGPSDDALPKSYFSVTRTCSVCLGDHLEDDDIIECDSCGVQVHESCYGVLSDDDEDDNESNQADNTSNHSNTSSKSTEPWFCEPCIRSVKNPYCELCPNLGGIFKQTDTGRWVHMVCALYTRGVTFENIDTLTGVSLFELNYALFGSKTCMICEDRRLARSGICIGCDAGLCKSFFHATCAQKEGLLFVSHSDEVDPYFAQCRQHADKTVIRKKKRTCTALHARLKSLAPNQSPNPISFQCEKQLEKLRKEPDASLTRWSTQNRPPIPPKASRLLMTSPSLIMKLTKKSELLGLDPKSSSYIIQDEIDMARQKWHIPPAFNLEFVAYCNDRIARMARMKKENTELVGQNANLKSEESSLREKYNSFKEVVEKVRAESEKMIKDARVLQKLVSTSIGKQFNLPLQMEQLIARCRNAGSNKLIKNSTNNDQTSSTHCCSKCGTVKDQHLLALCDTCHSYFHIYCLDPPLTRVPKKTRFGGWQCSDCSERDEEEQEEADEERNTLAIQEADEPRKLRERIKYPDKYSEESMLIADFWSTQKKRSKKSSKGSKSRKKIKIEAKKEAH